MRKFIFINLFFFIAFHLYAESYFQKLVNTAYRNNYFIKSYEKIVENSKENINLSKSYFLPQINFNFNFTQTDEPANAAVFKAKQGKFTMNYYYRHMANPPYIKNHQYVISLLQPIFSKGNVYLSKKQAEINYQAAIDSLNEVKRQIKFSIFETLINGYKVLDYIDIAKEMVKRSKVYLDTIENFYKNGTSLKADVLFARYNYEKAKVELNNAKNNLNKIENILRQLTGKHFEIKKENFKYSDKINKSELINYALNYRCDLQAMKKYLEIAKIEIKKAKNENLPAVYGFFNYERNGDQIFRKNEDGITAGIGLKFNIFNGFRNSIEINKAKLNYIKLEYFVKNKEEEVKRKIENAIIDFENSKYSYETYKSLVESNKTALNLSERRFNQGLERITTLVDMQTNYKKALKSYSQAKWDMILKYYKILYEAGKF